MSTSTYVYLTRLRYGLNEDDYKRERERERERERVGDRILRKENNCNLIFQPEMMMISEDGEMKK